MRRRSIEFKSSTQAQQQLEPTWEAAAAQNGQLSEHQPTAKKKCRTVVASAGSKKWEKKQLDLWIGLRCCCSRTRSKKIAHKRNKLTKCVKIVFKFHLKKWYFVFCIFDFFSFYFLYFFHISLSRALLAHSLRLDIPHQPKTAIDFHSREITFSKISSFFCPRQRQRWKNPKISQS